MSETNKQKTYKFIFKHATIYTTLYLSFFLVFSMLLLKQQQQPFQKYCSATKRQCTSRIRAKKTSLYNQVQEDAFIQIFAFRTNA